MTKYLNYLIEAFRQVDQKYYSWQSIRNYDGKLENQTINEQRTERVFAFELYHQYRKQMEFNSLDFSDLLFNAEVSKSYIHEAVSTNDYCLIDSNISSELIIPDLVLHKGQIYTESNSQKLIIEIKSTINPEVKKDLHKILLMIDKFNFEYGVFITINSELETVIKKIRDSFQKDITKYEELFNKLIILNRKSAYKEIYKENLLNILEQ